MGRKSFVMVCLMLVSTLNLLAQGGYSTFEFVENKGQWNNRIRYYGELSTGAFYLENNGFTVLLHHPKDLEKALDHRSTKRGPAAQPAGPIREDKPETGSDPERLTVRSHAYTVRFAGANENIQIIAEKPVDSYNNYFIGNDTSKWVSHARIYTALLYKNVYPDIDVRYYSENGRLKYDIIVHPGGDVNKIALRYDGVSKLSVKNRELIVSTTAGDVKELYPYSFQVDNVKGRTEIDARYEVNGNTVRFRVGNYSRSSTLVIDPSLIFSSFTGSRANQYGFTATPGPDGSLYSGGIVFGTGFPTTPGAFQSVFKGTGQNATDIGIMKFSPNGSQRLYATYIGGNANEYPHSLFCDPQGNLVVMGRSYSTDYPATRVGSGGGSSIVVTKLNTTGSALIGSLIIGGSSDDGVNIYDMQNSAASSGPISIMQNYGDDSRSEVILDRSNNIYVAAQTKSSDFPMRGNGFQKVFGGNQDGVVLKIDPDCKNLIWSSYIGGRENDGAFVLELNPSTGNLYVAGATDSDNFPGNKNGTINSGRVGNIDGFIAIISPDGTTLQKSTFIGTNNIDIIYGIKFDRIGFPYIMGTTRGNWQVVNAAYRNGNSKQFIAKVEPDLSAFVYSTVFGSGSPKPNMSPVAFLVDRCENVYVSGWGGGINPAGSDPFDLAGVGGMPVTQDAFKSVTDNRDFYFFVLEKNATNILFGSFFGQDGASGEHVDGGTSRFDQQGVIYQALCANCQGGANFPTTPGVVGPVNGAAQGCNLAAVKIAFNFAGVASGPRSFFNNVPDSIGCTPFTVILRDTVRNAKSYEWQFNDGTPDVTTTDFEINHTFQHAGTYRVRLIAIDSATCNIRDTAFLTIIVSDAIAQLNFNSRKLPPCESLSYEFDNLSIAPPGKPFGAQSFIWDFGDGRRETAGPGMISHSYAAPGTYNVRLIINDTSYCNSPDSIQVTLRVAPLVEARFETPPVGCAPYEAAFTNTSLAGESFFWDFGDGISSTETNPIHMYQNPGTYNITLIATDPATCNLRDTIQSVITVSAKPTAAFTFTPVPAEENKPTIFSNQSTGGVRYKWMFGDGDTTIKTTRDTVSHQYRATGVYNACLIVYNAEGCTDTICAPVEARILPLLDVPNAFTPGKFGKNSIVRVEGFGLARMTWRIYNRWGQKVFESADQRSGWDGTFKGILQPMDVYSYTLDVEFSDGTKTRKTGDITLIR